MYGKILNELMHFYDFSHAVGSLQLPDMRGIRTSRGVACSLHRCNYYIRLGQEQTKSLSAKDNDFLDKRYFHERKTIGVSGYSLFS